MPKTYTITAENTKELRESMKENMPARIYRKLQAVALRGEGKNNDEIGAITGFHPAYVSCLVSTYCNEGLDSFLRDGRKGGNNRNMSEAEAAEFLSNFEEQAKNGQIITVEDIAKAYDEAVGKTHESLSTVYYFLHSHGWRQITPRTTHPNKASDEAIEASKKLTQFTTN